MNLLYHTDKLTDSFLVIDKSTRSRIISNI